MEKQKLLELIRRQLGLRHKLKVHESMKMPETHDEMAVMMASKWEFEDEISAIEELINESRKSSVAQKKKVLAKDGAQGVKKSKKKSAQEED